MQGNNAFTARLSRALGDLHIANRTSKPEMLTGPDSKELKRFEEN